MADGVTHPAVTWRTRLLSAQQGIDLAYARRREAFREAHDAGLSMRVIAEAVGLTAAGVHKIIDRQQTMSPEESAELLDSPALSTTNATGGDDVQA